MTYSLYVSPPSPRSNPMSATEVAVPIASRSSREMIVLAAGASWAGEREPNFTSADARMRTIGEESKAVRESTFCASTDRTGAVARMSEAKSNDVGYCMGVISRWGRKHTDGAQRGPEMTYWHH